MSTLAGDVQFDFSFPCDPTTPPTSFTFDPALLEMPYNPGHSRSISNGSSMYSFESSPSDSIVSTSTRRTTPSRSPIRQHGPLLLPKIRSQDQNIVPNAVPHPPTRPSKRARTSPAPAASSMSSRNVYRPTHQRSYTNPETISYNPNPMVTAASFPSTIAENCSTSNLLCSPVMFSGAEFGQATTTTTGPIDNRGQRASSCNLDDVTIEKYGFPTYRQMPSYVAAAGTATHQSGSSTPTPQPAPAMLPVSSQSDLTNLPAPSSYFQPYSHQQQTYGPRDSSPLAGASLTPEPQPMQPLQNLQPSALAPTSTTTLLNYLTASNPAPSLVRTIAFPLRDPQIKHFWWDVRQIRPWSSFNTSTVMSLSGGAASGLLTCPVPESFLPNPMSSQRHPETERDLHSIYANWFVPKLNAALALSSNRPLQLSVPPKSGPHATRDNEQMFVATVPGDASSAAAIFGGKPSARVVGLVKSFDRFNTGMRVEGNVKKVEYLRGLAHLHHVMREHGCRYGFILTEIELVVVRNGLEGTPHFGFLEVTSCQLATTGADAVVVDLTSCDEAGKDGGGGGGGVPMTACLALWGLCMLAGDDMLPAGHAPWRAEIGAPAEGTRRKALPRDTWMPQPQLAEKREAKRSRGWVLPEDPVGRKELGKRGVRYGGAC
ncbi:hypothetical protein VMCG_01304 [Cytospora schulzeri]|uniref:Sialidase n=1 Tax=Cytospora schulzeri TaxID=448051 RepID=A0A423X627_9PEZI|nr:hypothetical protein VMCG_01304 [Valsa malicola]